MNLKKVLVLLVAVSMVFSLITGCGSQKSDPAATSQATSSEQTGTAKPELEKKTFTFYQGDSNAKAVQWSETPVGKKVEELTGVKLDMSFCIGSDEKTKVSLMIASGEYPDILYGHNEVQQFVNADVLIPLDELIEKYAPNIKKYYGSELKKFVDPKSNKLLTIHEARPGVEKVYQHTGYWLQSDVLKEAGWPKSLTFDQYIDVIRNYAKKHPTIDGKPVIPFSTEAESWRIFCLTLVPSYVNGNINEGPWYVDPNTNEAKLVYTADFSKNYFKKLNDLWNEGLFDKEAFTQGYDTLKAKVSQGRILGMYDHRWQMQDAINSLEAANKFGNVPVWIKVLEEGVTQDGYQFTNFQQAGVGGIGISTSCKDPVGVIKFLDRCLEEDIQTLSYWGIEGVDYTKGADGKYQVTEQQVANYLGNEYEWNQGYKCGAFILKRKQDEKLSNGNYVSPLLEEAFYTAAYKPYEKDILKNLGVKSFTELVDPQKAPVYANPNIKPPQETHEADFVAANKLDELVNQYVPRLVIAKPGQYENIWNEYMKKIEALKLDGYIKYVNDEIKKRVEQWK